MTANKIVIKIYNQQTLRVDLGEKYIKDYARKVAEEAYRMGFNDANKNRNATPSVALSSIDMDSIADE